MLGLEAETTSARPRAVDVRHLRRVLLQGPRDRSRRWRRLGDGRGHVPHQVRLQGHRHPPPRRAAGIEDHAGPGVRQPQDRVPVEHTVTTSSATTSWPAASCVNVGRRRSLDAAGDRAVRGDRPQPQHRPVQGCARHGGQRLPGHHSPARRTPTSTACSRAATCRTTPTARRSPPPAPGCMAAIDAERWLEAQLHSHVLKGTVAAWRPARWHELAAARNSRADAALLASVHCLRSSERNSRHGTRQS